MPDPLAPTPRRPRAVDTLVTRAMDISCLESFDAVFCLAQSLQLKHGKFMEQISEVEAFIGLNPINPRLKPVDVEGPDVRRVVARRGIDPGMGPDVEHPTPAFIVPSMVHVFSRRHVEEVEQFCFRVAQVNCVHSGLHGSVSPCGKRWLKRHKLKGTRPSPVGIRWDRGGYPSDT